MNYCDKQFAPDVHSGKTFGSSGRLKNVLLIGIGGSGFGSQFVSQALRHAATDKLELHFRDSADPDDIGNVLSYILAGFGETLTAVVSESGGAKETPHCALETKAGDKKANPSFVGHAVAVTSQDSALDKLAAGRSWLQRFPLWDWVVGRTSELSTFGLLPAALQCLDMDSLRAAGAQGMG
jgi:glucose-6-phosphate isomerase